MFKSNPKIKQITSCASGDFLFVFGIDKGGAVYIWNSIQCCWLPHQNVVPENAQQPVGHIDPPKKGKK